VTGVLHLAGVAGGGLLQLRAPADARAVLRPKVLGTLVLREALRGRPPLDLFVSFSSRAAVHGLVGSGDYVAANAVLDAFAADGGGRNLSIGWPAWSGVGMAVAGSRRVAEAPIDVELTLDPAVDWVLDEHRLDGRPVLPGTGHLDLVVSTFRGLGLISADDAVELVDACFQTALVADSAVAVRVRFTPDRDRWRFEVASGSGAEWTSHSAGWISGCARKDVLIPPAALREGFTEVEPPSLRPGPGRLFALGERWQNIDRMWRDDAKRERTVQLVLPAEFAADVEHCHAHPALLDGATATVRDDSDDVHLPFMYRRAVFHHVLPPVLFSHMKRGPDKPGAITADITMVAPDGTLLAEVEGFTMRRTGRQVHFLAEDAESRSAVSSAPLAAAADLLPTEADGLDPDEGGRLLTLLLGAATPNHVLVRPYVGGRPTPITGRPAVVERRASAVAAAPVETPASAPAERASSDVMLAAVLEMWQEALGADDLGPDDEFFELGGDSLSAVQLMGRIRERFGVEMSIAVLFDCPTARELTTELVRMAAEIA
jgi:acyl carrier protein